MKDEQLKILELLQEGKLTKEEALELLEALGTSAALETPPPDPSGARAQENGSAALQPAEAGATESRGDRLFPIGKDRLLEINLIGGGNIVITPWEREVMSVQSLKHFLSFYKVRFQETAAGSKIFSVGNQDLQLNVPAHLNLTIRTAGGDIEITGITGRIYGKTMGGDIKLARLSGNLDLASLGGDIYIADSAVNGKVHTMGGDITMINVSGDIAGTTMGGNVIRRESRTEAALVSLNQ